MSRKLFVNLAVADLARSVAFFEALGFAFDPRFTDESAACLVVSDEAYVMLLTRERFADFATREVDDPARRTAAIYGVSAESREGVDAFADAALAAGAAPANDPLDLGFMYLRSFHDPDGYLWEVMHMDTAAFEARADEAGAQAA